LKKFHRQELPAEPTRHKDLDDHILGEEFRQAERHLKSHMPMKSWTEVSKKDPEARDAQSSGLRVDISLQIRSNIGD
jgi:uncharacterized protein YfaQ (DUF2300 family)